MRFAPLVLAAACLAACSSTIKSAAPVPQVELTTKVDFDSAGDGCILVELPWKSQPAAMQQKLIAAGKTGKPHVVTIGLGGVVTKVESVELQVVQIGHEAVLMPK